MVSFNSFDLKLKEPYCPKSRLVYRDNILSLPQFYWQFSNDNGRVWYYAIVYIVPCHCMYLPVRDGNANWYWLPKFVFCKDTYSLQISVISVYVPRTITISWPLHQPTSTPQPPKPCCWISFNLRRILRRAYIDAIFLQVSESYEPQYKRVIIYIKVANRGVSLGFMVKAIIHA